jgi:antitoxin (DNA-binding transcriptional repressor) of toxin-antitoxin stability system
MKAAKTVKAATTAKKHAHISIGQARASFSDISNRVAYSGERVIIDRHHKPVMALVPIEDLNFLEAIENESDIKLARLRLKTRRKSGVTRLTDFEKEIENE